MLIVDDEPSILKLLRSALERDGFVVRTASRDQEAFAAISESPPDVILLDIALPGTDGIEICRQLNNDPETSHIPILLMTAYRRREIRLDGISAGARDFLVKPLDLTDLSVRVRNAADIKRQFDESQRQLQTIRELEGLRDSMVHMIVHDLKSPLTAVIGNLSLLEFYLEEELQGDKRSTFDSCVSGAQKMSEMVSSILTVSKLESGTLEPTSEATMLSSLVDETLKFLGQGAERIRVSWQPDPSQVKAALDPELIQRVIQNLLTNALDHSPPDEPVDLRLSLSGTALRITVADKGTGVPEEDRELIFEKFGQAKGRTHRRGSIGMGLAFCKLAVEAHGGEIGVIGPPEGGSVFWFEVPSTGAENPVAGDGASS